MGLREVENRGLSLILNDTRDNTLWPNKGFGFDYDSQNDDDEQQPTKAEQCDELERNSK